MPGSAPDLGGLPAAGGSAAGWQLVQFLVASAAVIGLALWGGRWLARRVGGLGGGRHLKLVDALAVGPNRMVGLVAVAGRVLVVGVTEHHISLLATLDGDGALPGELVAAAQPEAASPGGGGGLFGALRAVGSRHWARLRDGGGVLPRGPGVQAAPPARAPAGGRPVRQAIARLRALR